MKSFNVLDILKSNLSNEKKLSLIQMLQWKRLSFMAKTDKDFKKYFQDLVSKQIHKLNTKIYTLYDSDPNSSNQIKRITERFLSTPKQNRKNILILCYDSDNDYCPIFLH